MSGTPAGATDQDLLVLDASDVAALSRDREAEIVAAVRQAYEIHQQGQSELPLSSFLRVPDDSRNRIIALPAWLGGPVPVSGIKWIASYPGNLDRGLERASALIVLNSCQTGFPRVVLEGGAISAKRTAASAALAALHLRAPGPTPRLGLVGCGRINFEVALFVARLLPGIETLLLYDVDRQRAQALERKLEPLDVRVQQCASLADLLSGTSLVSFATTAATPHVADLSICPAGATLLHLSLRDLTAEAVLTADNVVDDVEHVCRENTSVELAERRLGHRRFIAGTLAEVTSGVVGLSRTERPLLFSPFGLGVLDVAVAALVAKLAGEQSAGQRLSGFFRAAPETNLTITSKSQSPSPSVDLQ